MSKIYATKIPNAKEILEKNGCYCTKVVGISMNPFIWQSRDTVFIVKKTARLKKYDVAFFISHNGDCVLHRVKKVRKNSYDIIGDNNFYMDKFVPEGNVIGVLEGYYKRDKYIKCSSRLYKFKTRLYCFFPIKAVFIFFNRVGRKLNKMFSKKEK